MDHRHQEYACQVPQVDHSQIQSSQYPDPCLFCSEKNCSSVTIGHENQMHYASNGVRPMNYTLSSSEPPNFRPANLGMLHNMNQHSSSAISSDQFPHSQFSSGDRSAAVNPQFHDEMPRVKRKTNASSPSFRRMTAHLYSVPSSSNLSSECLGKSIPSCHQSAITLDHGYRTTNGPAHHEEFRRNVRSRTQFLNWVEDSIPSYQPICTQASSSSTYYVAGASGLAPIPAQNSPCSSVGIVYRNGINNHTSRAEEFQRNAINQNVTAPYPVCNSTLACQKTMVPNVPVSRAMNQPARAGQLVSEAYRANFFQNVNQNVSFSRSGGHLRQSTNSCHDSYARAMSGYSTVGYVSDSVRQRTHLRIDCVASTRNPCPLPLIDHRRVRSRFTCSIPDGFVGLQNQNNACGRLATDVVRMGQPSFYHSVGLFDEHSDMRLDVDNMSYEELLALEERIGNVSTGLSEEAIAKCLVETNYCSAKKEDPQKHCSICLEEYKDGENLGSLQCKHCFHGSCIQEWLLIKNTCPLCKAAALSDTAKGKQIVPS